MEWQKWAIWLPAAPALWLAWWLWWRLPKREVAKLRHGIRDPKARVDVEDTLRKTIGQALGGIVVLFGAGFGLVQFLDQRETAQKQIQASHDLLVSNQIAKGFEQLGSDKIEVRLGGIFALEGILHMSPPEGASSPDYRQSVLEALCAFVREHTIGMIVQEQPTTDVQAVLTVIGRRASNLGDVNLVGVKIPGAKLIGASLLHADLTVAELGRANLATTNLVRANLFYADLSSANLIYADLNGAILIGANLSDATLINASLSGILEPLATGTGTIKGTPLVEKESRSSLPAPIGVRGNYVLYITDLSDAKLRRADFRGAALRDAKLLHADLTDATLAKADLTDADLTGADLTNADLSDADLSGAHLDNQEQLSKACGKPKALPEGFTIDRPCPDK